MVRLGKSRPRRRFDCFHTAEKQEALAFIWFCVLLDFFPHTHRFRAGIAVARYLPRRSHPCRPCDVTVNICINEAFFRIRQLQF